MNKDEIFNKILEWQNENGESFLDYFGSNLNELSFMFWCLGKGYIQRDAFNIWVKARSGGIVEKLSATDPNYYVTGNEPFSIVQSVHGDINESEEAEKRGLMIVADFISQTDEYINRFNKFLNENDSEEDDEE